MMAPEREAGQVASAACRLGGRLVILDRARGADWIDADYRWVVMHLPSTLHVAVGTRAHARAIMEGVAEAPTLDEAARHADILPEEGA